VKSASDTIGLQPMEFQFSLTGRFAVQDTIGLQPMEFQFQPKAWLPEISSGLLPIRFQLQPTSWM